MKLKFTACVLTICVLLMAGCATTGYKTSYIQAEQSWLSLAKDYEAYRAAGLVSIEDQRTIEHLLSKASDILDVYKMAVLSGEPTGEIVVALNNVKRMIIIELSKMED